MDENNENQHLSETFLETGAKPTFTSHDDQNGEGPQEIQYYTVHSSDAVPKRFKLVLRSGETISLPYSLLPVIMLENGDRLYIKAFELLVTITGRNLEPLENALSLEKVKTIHESLSKKDTGESEVFVKNIIIEGKAVEKHIEP